MFGQTETSGIVAVYPIAIAPDTPVAVVPLGRPIANTRIYLLDSHLQPVPIGVAGELYISGPGVGLGYLQQPEQTAARFIPNPFSFDPSDGLYKTGDRGRYRADGTIEFLSRSDSQVKLRGFRIELGEIETRLNQHPGVGQAVVMARETRPGETALVAYVVPARGANVSASDLQQFLRERLPDYMVPTAIACLETLPLTPNGKLDRQALRAIAPETIASHRPYQPPRTPVEEV